MAKYRRVWKRIPNSKPRRWRRVWQRIQYPTATHYSPNFTRAELNCRGTDVPGDCGCNGKSPSRKIQRRLRRLALALEQVRARYGGPLPTLSVYRCPAHNRFVGGASKSFHMTGLAVDFNMARIDRGRLKDALRGTALGTGGQGDYPGGGLHRDLGPTRYWTSF